LEYEVSFITYLLYNTYLTSKIHSLLRKALTIYHDKKRYVDTLTIVDVEISRCEKVIQ